MMSCPLFNIKIHQKVLKSTSIYLTSPVPKPTRVPNILSIRVYDYSTVLLPRADLNVGAAMLALFSLFLMVMGAICITMSLSKEILFFLKPASVCFILSGQ